MNSSTNTRRSISRWIVAGTLAGTVLGGVGIAAAQDSSTTTTPSAPSTQGQAPNGRAASNETPLTGESADKVTAAAKAAVPGATVDRVETDDDGSPFEAHITKSDGTRATVKIDANYSVTAVQDDAGRGKGGPGGDRPGGPRPGSNETPLTGDTADKVTAAAQAAVPGGTVDRVETDDDGSPYEAHVTKSDGTHATVKVDANFSVTSVEDEPAHPNGGPGKGGPRGDHAGAPAPGAPAPGAQAPAQN